MRIDRNQFLFAARSFGGWIDRHSGQIIRRGWMGDSGALFIVRNGECVLLEVEPEKDSSLLEIPRLCPGYAELCFLRRNSVELEELIQSYGLEQYMNEPLPAFMDSDTREEIIQTGRRIWNRCLMMREENESIQRAFESDAIEEAILDDWCAKNGIQLTDR
ncbi:MAG: hypothetical protein J6M10_01040 [Clostridia bacterium]|nr:hypothetical protein [Clostridia bacterium]